MEGLGEMERWRHGEKWRDGGMERKGEMERDDGMEEAEIERLRSEAKREVE